MSVLLEAKNVVQAFRVGFWLKRTEILHGVSLDVPEGSIFGFLGANGAGKTTLIHLIVGIRRPLAGTVMLGGHHTHTVEARTLLGYLPERPYFHDHLTGEEFLIFFGRLSGMKRPEIMTRIPEVLEEVGMGHARKLELKRYSKGMLQRIGIAQAILHQPKFLVLDEPMSGLDPLGRKEIRELISRLASQGRTIFFSSHVIPDVEAICTQVALIKKGQIVGCGPISKLMGAATGAVEISFDGVGLDEAQKVAGLANLQILPEAVRGVVSRPDQLNSVLLELLRIKANILSVAPTRPSLEDWFK
jgi:ABC-2 type transport system ATP-binding protein